MVFGKDRNAQTTKVAKRSQASEGHDSTTGAELASKREEAGNAGDLKACMKLVKRAMKGDDAAKEAVISLYYKDVLYFAVKKVGPQDCEDVAQQVAAKVIDGLEGLRDPAKVKSWIFSIAYNSCMDILRDRQRATAVMATEEEYDQESLLDAPDRYLDFLPEEALMEAEQRRLAVSIFDGLPDRYADCLRLRYKDELSYKEIAMVMDVDLKKVKNDMYLGMALFKKRYEQETKKCYQYTKATAGSVPVLSQILALDFAETLQAGVAGYSLFDVGEWATGADQASALLPGTGVQGGHVGQILAGSAASLALCGGLVAYIIGCQTPDESSSQGDAVVQAAPPPKEAGPPSPEVIDTVGEMIGEEEAARLASFEDSGVQEDAWLSFLARIGAKPERFAHEADCTYTMYVLRNGDMRLVLVDRVYPGRPVREVVSIFGPDGELPRMMKVILMFP